MFDELVEIIFEHEGGLVDDPNDPGGRTIYGIAITHHPEAWADGTPTKDESKAIYRRDYWELIKGDLLHPAVALCVFDSAVNQGTRKASKMLQEACGASVDGIIGKQTTGKANKNPGRTVERFMVKRVEHYASISGWKHYSTGWMKRVFRVHKEALERL